MGILMQRIMELRGALPERLREQGRLTSLYFDSTNFLPETGKPLSLSSFKERALLPDLAASADFGEARGLSPQEQAQLQLSKLIGGVTVGGAARKKQKASSDGEKRLQSLSSLLESCLDLDPAARITASKAVGHEIFQAST